MCNIYKTHCRKTNNVYTLSVLVDNLCVKKITYKDVYILSHNRGLVFEVLDWF